MHPNGNGRDSRQRLLALKSVRAALMSPFGKIPFRCFSPAAALCWNFQLLTSLIQRFSLYFIFDLLYYRVGILSTGFHERNWKREKKYTNFANWEIIYHPITFCKKWHKKRRNHHLPPFLQARLIYTARCTLPERRQRVQTFTRLGVPFTIARTLLMFGFQVRLERLCEWLTLIPKDTPFPQISHFAILKTPPMIKQYRILSQFLDLFPCRLTHTIYILTEIWEKCKPFFQIYLNFLLNRQESCGYIECLDNSSCFISQSGRDKST